MVDLFLGYRRRDVWILKLVKILILSFSASVHVHRSENIVLVIGLIHEHSPWLRWEEEENAVL